MNEKKQVLFLCTSNSARSQMAEALVNHFLAPRWEARSAGTSPASSVHPLAVEAMAELGIDISGKRPKSAEQFRNEPFDAVVTLCDDAAKNCPLWIGPGHVAHLAFPDPAAAQGELDSRLEVFREVRDDIRDKVLGRLRQLDDGQDKEDTHDSRDV
jgi:arsenate reductase